MHLEEVMIEEQNNVPATDKFKETEQNVLSCKNDILFHQKSKENRMQLVMILAQQSTHMINQEQCQAQI